MMPRGNTIEYFTVKIWTEKEDNIHGFNQSGHVSLTMHDGTYISVFRSRTGIQQCTDHSEDVARLGRDSDITLSLSYKDHLRHPERIRNWLQSYRNGEKLYDPQDSCCSVVYSVLVRSGGPYVEKDRLKLEVDDMKDYLYGIMRHTKRKRKQVA